MPTETTLNERGRAPSDSALATGRARRVLLCAYSRAPRVRGLATPDVRGTGNSQNVSVDRLDERGALSSKTNLLIGGAIRRITANTSFSRSRSI
jgi:hypothetical protein